MQINEYMCRAKVYGTNEWVHGYYTKCIYYLDDDPIGLIIQTDAILFPRNEIASMCVVDINTVCRCTGLKDKNGTTIFENDYVCTQYGRICKVVWFSSPAHCGWDLMPVDRLDCTYPDKYSVWAPKNLEVCGNSFDEQYKINEEC